MAGNCRKPQQSEAGSYNSPEACPTQQSRMPSSRYKPLRPQSSSIVLGTALEGNWEDLTCVLSGWYSSTLHFTDRSHEALETARTSDSNCGPGRCSADHCEWALLSSDLGYLWMRKPGTAHDTCRGASSEISPLPSASMTLQDSRLEAIEASDSGNMLKATAYTCKHIPTYSYTYTHMYTHVHTCRHVYTNTC